MRDVASRRQFLVLAVTGAVSGLIAACSSAASPAPPTAAATKPTSAPSGSPPPGPAASPASSPPPAASPAAVATGATATALDASLTDVWSGKTISLVIGTAPGGGYDTWARLLARHLPRYLPGSPTVVAQNMPGANHKIATNFVYAAKPDGLTLGMVDRNMPIYPLRGEGEAEGVRYDVTRLNWLASAATTQLVLLIHERAGISRVDQLVTTEVRVGNASPATPPHVVQVALSGLLGLKLKSFFGYEGNSAILLGIDRGEVDAYLASWDAAMQARGDAIRGGSFRPIVIAGRRPADPLLANVPTASELFKDRGADAQQVLALVEEPYRWAWPFMAPPSLEPRVLTGLRNAFKLSLADPELREEARRIDFSVEPVDGEDVQSLIQRYMQTPRAAASKLDELIKADSPQ